MKKWLFPVLAGALSLSMAAGTWIALQKVNSPNAAFEKMLAPGSQIVAKDVITPDKNT